MYLHDTLLACPACNCHARSSASHCPFCGAALRNDDGSRTRTAGAVLLGLALAAAPQLAACGGSTVSSDYGVATTVSAGGTGGEGTASSTTGGTGGKTASASTSGGFGGAQTDYGVAVTTSSQAASSSTSGGFGGAHSDYGVPATSAGVGGASGH